MKKIINMKKLSEKILFSLENETLFVRLHGDLGELFHVSPAIAYDSLNKFHVFVFSEVLMCFGNNAFKAKSLDKR